MTTDETALATDGVASRPVTAAEARAAVRRLLHEEFCSEAAGTSEDVVLANALLVTSELVTNAIRHGGGLVRFSAHVSDHGLRLAVTDRTRVRPATVPSANDAAAMRSGGYGWRLVQRLSSDVAIHPAPGGKTIEVLVPLI
ncbi:ATP-binding protein [Streptomyces sp. NPDC059176]|uniref:ATP-binding protein n=1 Tax=unclassified Streptomyces TaxID=2593676 RepID=UPI0036861BE2